MRMKIVSSCEHNRTHIIEKFGPGSHVKKNGGYIISFQAVWVGAGHSKAIFEVSSCTSAQSDKDRKKEFEDLQRTVQRNARPFGVHARPAFQNISLEMQVYNRILQQLEA